MRRHSVKCSTCGDELPDGTADCLRCNWGGWTNTPHDNTVNPPDPTIDMHRGIQASMDPSCPKCGSPMYWRDAAGLTGLHPEGAWECSNQRCWNMLTPGNLAPDIIPEDPDTGHSDLTLPDHWSMVHEAPFKSEKQRAYMHIHHPEIADDWEEEYPDDPVQPDKKQKKKGSERGVYYHVAPRSARDSILQHGLIGHQGDGTVGSPWEDANWAWRHHQPHGNYLFDHPEQAQDYIAALHGKTPQLNWEDYEMQGPEQEDYGPWAHPSVYPQINYEDYNSEEDYERALDEQFEHERGFSEEDDLHKLAPHHQGWDIWKTNIDPDKQRILADPESGLRAEHSPYYHREDEPYPSTAEALHGLRQDREQGKGWGPNSKGETTWDPSWNGEPLRWYTPDHIPPQQLEHQSWHPYWSIPLYPEDQDWQEGLQQQLVPEPFNRIPTQRYFGRTQNFSRVIPQDRWWFAPQEPPAGS